MNNSKQTFNYRDKANLLDDKELKKQIDETYSCKCKSMFKQLKKNKLLLNQYKISFENNEKLFIQQYSKYKGCFLKNKTEFINIINKQNVFNLFGIQSDIGKIYKSNIIDTNIYKEINNPKKSIRDKLMQNLLNTYNLDNDKNDLFYIEEDETKINITIKNESYHYIDFDNSKQPYLYIVENNKSKEYIWKYSIFDIYCAIYNYTVGEAIQILSKQLDIKIYIIDENIKKYSENINWIELKFNEYPNLYKLMKDSKNILNLINKLSIERVYQSIYNEKTYVALDYTTISNEIGLKKATITPYINLFCALGLLEKKPISNKSKKRNCITLFYVPKYDSELFNNADEESKKLLEMKISKSGFDLNICKKVFGLEMAKNIFQDNNTIKKLYKNTEDNIN